MKNCPVCNTQLADNVMHCDTCHFSFHPMIGVNPEEANRMLEEKRQAYRREQMRVMQQDEEAAWKLACDVNTSAAYQQYLANPNWGKYRDQAFARMRDGAPINNQYSHNASPNRQFDDRTASPAQLSQSWDWQWLHTMGRVLWQAMQWLARVSPGAFAIIFRIITQVSQFAYRMMAGIVRGIRNFIRAIYRFTLNFFETIENTLRHSFISFLIDFAYWGVGLFFSFSIAASIVKTFIHLPDKMGSDWYLIFMVMIGLVFYALWLNIELLNRYRFWLSVFGVSIIVLILSK